MKNTLLLLGAAILLFSCNQTVEETATKNYELSLNAKGFRDSTLFIIYSSDLKTNIDSGYIVNGELKLTGSVDFPQYVKIHTPFEDKHAGDYRRLLFWLENKSISITGDFQNFDQSIVTGSPLNAMHHQIDSELEALDVVRDSLLRTYREMNDRNSYIVQTIDHYDSLRRDIIFSYIENHPNNEVCIRKLALYKQDMSVEQLQFIFSKVEQQYHTYMHSQEIMAYINEKVNADLAQKDLLKDLKENQDFTSVD